MDYIARKLAALAIASGALMFMGHGAMAEDVALYKNPQCGCCENYAGYLRKNGFKVTVYETHDLAPMSRKVGIPDKLQGCHLARIGKYAVSGHVPVSIVQKLLKERPAIKGVTLPGMPQGSPGMSGTKTGPFKVYEIGSKNPKIYAQE